MEPYNPFSAPQVMDAAVIQPAGFPKRYGGIGRLAYFGSYMGLILILVFMETVMSPSVEFAILSIPLAAIPIVLTVLRLKNQGVNGWLAFLMFIPIANIVIYVRCLAFPEGYQDTRKLDRAGKIVVGILVAGIALWSAVVVVTLLWYSA